MWVHSIIVHRTVFLVCFFTDATVNMLIIKGKIIKFENMKFHNENEIKNI